MKPILSFRTSLLIGCAAFALIAVNAQATDVNAPAPSVEIHLDALSKLGHYQPNAEATPKTKEVASSEESGVAPKSLKKHGKKSQHAQKPAKTQVASAETAQPEAKSADNSTEPPRLEETSPVKQSAATTAPAATDQTPALAAPSKPQETVASAQPATSGPETPKLPAADLAQAAPAKSAPAPARKEGALSSMTGGFSDLLGGDSEKAAPETKPAVTQQAQAKLALPPVSEVSAPVAATKELPSAPDNNALPPLVTQGKSADKDTDKLVLASNEPPPMSDVASSKSDAPPPLSPSDEAPKELAQSTLTPLPNNAASPPPLTPTPAPAPVAAAPAPTGTPAAAATPAPAPAAAATPTPEATPQGPAPDVRITFNENETEMPLAAGSQLDGIAKTLHDNPNTRVTIVGYANGPETTGIYPKRVSLARGIAVRNYLTTTKGIDIERVNVKAMGNKNEGGPGDRVDLYIVK